MTVPLVSATDVVLTLDTSGSMSDDAREVSHWLATSFEPALRKVDSDLRLVVVGNLKQVDRFMRRDPRPRWSPSSGGINVPWSIASRDSFDVLLSSAVAKKELSWLAATRPGSSVHVVIVTDDDPTSRSARSFVARLTALVEGEAGARPLRVHGLLGYLPHPSALVLGPDDDVVKNVCGERAGADYQIVTQETGGLRASSCHRGSLEAFTTALAHELRTEGAGRCRATLPAPLTPERLASVHAVSTDARYELTRAPGGAGCTGPQAYEIAGESVWLCPETCAATKQAGIAWLELSQRCE